MWAGRKWQSFDGVMEERTRRGQALGGGDKNEGRCRSKSGEVINRCKKLGHSTDARSTSATATTRFESRSNASSSLHSDKALGSIVWVIGNVSTGHVRFSSAERLVSPRFDPPHPDVGEAFIMLHVKTGDEQNNWLNSVVGIFFSCTSGATVTFEMKVGPSVELLRASGEMRLDSGQCAWAGRPSIATLRDIWNEADDSILIVVHILSTTAPPPVDLMAERPRSWSTSALIYSQKRADRLNEGLGGQTDKKRVKPESVRTSKPTSVPTSSSLSLPLSIGPSLPPRNDFVRYATRIPGVQHDVQGRSAESPPSPPVPPPGFEPIESSPSLDNLDEMLKPQLSRSVASGRDTFGLPRSQRYPSSRVVSPVENENRRGSEAERELVSQWMRMIAKQFPNEGEQLAAMQSVGIGCCLDFFVRFFCLIWECEDRAQGEHLLVLAEVCLLMLETRVGQSVAEDSRERDEIELVRNLFKFCKSQKFDQSCPQPNFLPQHLSVLHRIFRNSEDSFYMRPAD